MSLLLGATLVGLALLSLGGFISWRTRVLARVLRGGEIAETAKGPVEFAIAGTGPVILQLHGGGSGYDQTLALSWDLHEAGFTVLRPSRPGYLRTPLTTGASPEQAADVLAGLLDVLSIDKVCVIGTSGGGPTALQFALRHPERVSGLVLQAAISQRHVQPSRSTNSLIGRVLFTKSGKWPADFVAWGMHLLARYWPAILIRSLLNASDDLDRSKSKYTHRRSLFHPEVHHGRCRELRLLKGKPLDHPPKRRRKPLPALVVPDLAGQPHQTVPAVALDPVPSHADGHTRTAGHFR
jgi:pimeloyl-ACP methyl ester carboxylesterase